MRFLIGTAHVFAPTYRDAGMHRFAKVLAQEGHYVDFVTLGQSRLKQALKPELRHHVAAARAASREGANPPNLHAYVHREWVHPPSGSRAAELLSRSIERRYGRAPDRVLQAAAHEADVVILECGYALYWYAAIRRLNPHAKFLAFYNDRLDLVGFRAEVLAMTNRLLPLFDLVRTNAERLLDYLPPGTNGRYVPQGIDKAQIRFDLPSPYGAGKRVIVSVGNMLFDEAAVRGIAAAAPDDVELHVIGAQMAAPPANVTVHGELPFDRTLPFIVHAAVGLAPYRPVDGADYLAQSSLKIQQYAYCGLPVLIPGALGIHGENLVYYNLDDRAGLSAAVAQALATEKTRRYGAGLLDWSEVGDMLLREIAALDFPNS